MQGLPTANPSRAAVKGPALQHYSRQIEIAVVSVVLFAVLYLVASGPIESIPRDGFSTLAGMYATLLGLTFTAFSILTAIVPNVPKGLLRTPTFAMLGQTFVATMWLQLVTVLAAGLCYLGFGEGWVPGTGLVVVFLAILSAGFLILVVQFMFYLFKLVRREVGGGSQLALDPLVTAPEYS